MSVPPGILVEQIMEATDNREKSIGYIAEHPERGIFLGLDQNKEAVFVPAADLPEDQMIPIFYAPEYIDDGCHDIVILECRSYKVDVTDTENEYTRAGNVINDGAVVLTDKDNVRLRTIANNNFLSRGLHRVSHATVDPLVNAARRLAHHFSKSGKPFDPVRSYGRVYKPVETQNQDAAPATRTQTVQPK